jgi:hypothetical protein
MNIANTVIKAESEAVDLRGKTVMHGDAELTVIAAPQRVLQSALADLNRGRFSEVVKHFDQDGCFRFSDQALALVRCANAADGPAVVSASSPKSMAAIRPLFTVNTWRTSLSDRTSP